MDTKQLNVPENFHELLQRPEKKDFEITAVYFLELSHAHGLWGFFPAVFAADTKRMVLTPDVLLLKAVWETLTPRRSHIGQAYFCLNPALSIGYEVRGDSGSDEQKRSKPMQILTQEEFNRLIAEGGQPFQWAPGLVGDDMNADEFRQTIEAAQQTLREAF
ncbi:MAG: hypothetical protein NUV60_03355 [Patescibacteria group bacterium]|nr:hypothetical protein [Patescibacteria group bacterium]